MRNLTEQLKKLSQELADAVHDSKHSPDLTEEQAFQLDERIEDIQDQIWDIEETLREFAEHEFSDRSSRGWT